MKAQKERKNHRVYNTPAPPPEIPRKSSKVLNEFLNSSLKKSPHPRASPQMGQTPDLAPNGKLIGFYHSNIPLGTQAKAEKPANSNSESGVNECSAVSLKKISPQNKMKCVKKDKYSLKNKSGISLSDKQSLLNGSQAGDEAEKVEESLRDFIGKIIGYYEKLNMGNSLLGKYENKISMAETLLEVFDLMKEMFEELMQNVLKESRGLLDCSDVSEADIKSEEMDRLIHQFETEIRVMAGREKDLIKQNNALEKSNLKKDSEFEKLKKKYDEVSRLRVASNRKVLSKLSDMTYYTENLMQENKKYKKFIEDFQLGVNLFQQKNSQIPFTSSMKEIIQNSFNEQQILNKSNWDQKKHLLPNRKNSFPYKENCFKKLNSKNFKNPVLIDFGSPVIPNNRLSIGSEQK